MLRVSLAGLVVALAGLAVVAATRGFCTARTRIGSAARAADVEGLLVPSARVDTGTSLVIFPDRLREGSTVELYVGNEPTIPRYALQGRYKARNS